VRLEIKLGHPPKEDACLQVGRENFLDARLRLPCSLSLRIPTLQEGGPDKLPPPVGEEEEGGADCWEEWAGEEVFCHDLKG
jgi:hypothetical protein